VRLQGELKYNMRKLKITPQKNKTLIFPLQKNTADSKDLIYSVIAFFKFLNALFVVVPSRFYVCSSCGKTMQHINLCAENKQHKPYFKKDTVALGWKSYIS